jgi:tRNA (guanosine-2'-O-)-methyltransferase
MDAREAKMRKVISAKQTGLTVVLENVDDPHNISAVLRTCDAVGILDVHLIRTIEPAQRKLGKKSSASAKKWIRIHEYQDVKSCFDLLKKEGKTILATHLSSDAQQLFKLDLTVDTALVFGNEHSGVSQEVLELADGNFIIPQTGMIPSLNISVACAVTLYEAYRQKELAGHYLNSNLTEKQISDLLEDWKNKGKRIANK